MAGKALGQIGFEISNHKKDLNSQTERVLGVVTGLNGRGTFKSRAWG